MRQYEIRINHWSLFPKLTVQDFIMGRSGRIGGVHSSNLLVNGHGGFRPPCLHCANPMVLGAASISAVLNYRPEFATTHASRVSSLELSTMLVTTLRTIILFLFAVRLGSDFAHASDEVSKDDALGDEETHSAIDLATAAILENPKEPTLFDLRGRLWLLSRNWDRAIDDFSKVIELDPKNSRALAGRGCARFNKNSILRKNSEYRSAAADLSAAVEADP